MRKKVLSFMTAAILLLSLFSAALAAESTKKPTFSDVPETHWAFTSIEDLVARKAINGYPDGNFYPERTVSREEFAKIMVVAAGLMPAPAETSTYADVPLTYWASAYIETARPYMTAYQNQGQLYFYPTAGALREDIAVAVVKLRGLDPAQADLSLLEAMFTDLSSISTVARPYVALAVEQGIINGYTDGTFRGQGTITRAEAAAILWRAFQQGSGDKVIPDDILPSPAPTPEVTPTPAPKTDIQSMGWALVTGADKGSRRARLLFADGTTMICNVDSEWNAWHEGDLILCGRNKTNNAITLLSESLFITAGYDSAAQTFGGMTVSKNAVLFAETTQASTGERDAEYSVFLLQDLSYIAPRQASYAIDNRGRVTVIYMDLDLSLEVPTGTQYGYITSDSMAVSVDGTRYTEFTIWNGEEELTVMEKGKASWEAGTVISFTYEGDSVIGEVEEITNIGAINAYDGHHEIHIIDTEGNEFSYYIDDSTVTIYVDSTRKEGIEQGEIGLANLTDQEDGWISNICFQPSDNGTTLDVIFVDINNYWEGLAPIPRG